MKANKEILNSKKLEDDYKKLEEELKFIEEFTKGNTANLKFPGNNRPISLQDVKKKVTSNNNPNQTKAFDKDKYDKQAEKFQEKQKLKEIEKLEAKLFKQTKRLVSDVSKEEKDKVSKKSKVQIPSKIDDFDKVSTKQFFMSKTKKELQLIDKPKFEVEKLLFPNNDILKKQLVSLDTQVDASDNINEDIQNEKNKEKEFFNSLSKEKRFSYLSKYKEAFQFLKDINLTRYIEVFIEEGFDQLNCIIEIEESFLLEKGFSKTQIDKIINKINSIKKSIIGELEIETKSNPIF